MDVVLVSIAGLSLFLAIAMGVILFKVLRDDRQRADARIAALAAAAAALEPPANACDVEIAPVRRPAVVPSGELFAVAQEPSPWARRLGVAAAFAAVIAGAGYVLLPARTAGSDAASTTAAAPLELLTLTHTQEPSGLTITGTVYNPRGGAPVSQASAAAILFGPDGNFLTSARAPLDFTTVAPGQESPFVIRVPVTGTVARYRVGFRSADGSVIAHVDRRADGTAARNAPSGGIPWVH
jgi:hypothetical protein